MSEGAIVMFPGCHGRTFAQLSFHRRPVASSPLHHEGVRTPHTYTHTHTDTELLATGK